MHGLGRWILVLSFVLSGPLALAQDGSGLVLALDSSQVLAVSGVSSVSDDVFRGPRLTVENVHALAAAGIGFIINLQGGDLETPRWFGLLKRIIRYTEPGELKTARDIEANAARNDNKMGYVNIPVNSLDPVSPDQAFRIEQILLLVRILAVKGIPLYIHCEHGKDRTGLIVALYRVRYEGWSIERAHREWQVMGHSGFLNSYFTGNLDLFFASVAPRLLEAFERENFPGVQSAPADCEHRLAQTSQRP